MYNTYETFQDFRELQERMIASELLENLKGVF